jgi:energy-coupling factor transporter ATP-binding protein EcfA2
MVSGIERTHSNGPPVFQDYGRFTDLMSSTDPAKRGHQNLFGLDSSRRSRDTRTPSLVSFVGQTGAGKSTLIKLLIDLASDDSTPFPVSQGATAFPTPVIGATGGHLPTSEDVHLYLDPRTAHSASPILFADCEGLEGGEREPAGAKYKKKRKQEEYSKGHRTRIATAINEQEITWADSPRTRTREFAVTNLYPRLLYTFSDVIIFVLKNPRFMNRLVC